MNVAAELIEWGQAAATKQGETQSGDRYVVEAFPDGVLVGVIDGIGHGEEAAFAADAAVAILRRSPGQPIIHLLRSCHDALKQTRGAVMNLAAFSARNNSLTWLGVGNVEGVLVRAPGAAGPRVETILALGGLVGLQLPVLRPSTIPVRPGDTLIFATDGIRPDFSRALAPGESPQRIAQRICTKSSKGNDDALALVVRYLGNRT